MACLRAMFRVVAAGTASMAALAVVLASPATAAHAGSDGAQVRAAPVAVPGKRARKPIRLAALGQPDSPALSALSEEEGLRVLQQDLSLKVGKHMQPFDYPAEAMRWRWSGTVLVAAVIAGDGAVKDVAVSRTSGFRVLDEQALVVVRRVSRLFVPAGLRVRERTITVPVGFYLQSS
jgi:protein TonB